MVVCLEGGADLHMAQVMPLPLTVSRNGTRKVKPIWILLKQETVSGSGTS